MSSLRSLIAGSRLSVPAQDLSCILQSRGSTQARSEDKPIQRAKLDRFPSLRERSASIVISEEVGVMKPNSALFEHAAEQASIEPEEILYVGDSLHSDIEGGRNAGWQVAWFRGESGLRDDVHVFEDWSDLLAHLL